VSKSQDWVHLAAFELHGTNVFLASAEGIEDWSLAEKPLLDQFDLKPMRSFKMTGQHGRLLLSTDGRTLGSGTKDAVHLFDLATGEETRQLKGPYNDIFSALSPDAHFAATWDRFSTNVQIWDVAKSNVFLNLPAHYSICAAFSPNGDWFVVGDEVEFRAWDAHTWRSLYALPRDIAGFWGYLAFSGNSQLLAVAISRSRVRLIEAATGRELATLEAPEPMDICWIAFDDAGSQLAVVTAGGAIQLWDLRLVRQQLVTMKLDWESQP
jgi:WD40 repeat protein